MECRLWNLGLKVADLEKEMRFLQGLGARLLLHETLTGPGGDSEYAMLEFGGTRILLTPKPVYEDRLDYQLMPGLAHAVFEVDDLDREYERIVASGAEVLIKPQEISGGFGTRRISFFRSPNGLILEVMQILDAKV